MKKFFLLLMALAVAAAAVWLAITSLRPAKHKILTSNDTAATAHGLEAVQRSSTREAPTPAETRSPTPPAKDGGATSSLPRETPSPLPAATVPPGRPPEKKALASSVLPKESSPPLLAPALPPIVDPIKAQPAEQSIAQTSNNAETSNFEPTTLTVVRTFVLTLPDGNQVEQSVSIPVLYRRGSIALKSDQLEQLGVIQSQIGRILDANEELRVAADLLITKQRKDLAGSVPTEVLGARSSSVLPGGPGSPGTTYVNVPQGSVEIAPANKEP
jgi:hypothetical protein